MSGPSGRTPRPAETNTRRSFTGHGTLTTVEKDGLGLLIDDTVYAFADISVPCIPLLYVIMVTTTVEFGGIKSAAMIGWLTMVLGTALIRGGWIQPLFTDIPGWVSLSPLLIGLRFLYFNLALAVIAYGGDSLGKTVQVPILPMGWAVMIGGLAVGIFPALAGAIATRRHT